MTEVQQKQRTKGRQRDKRKDRKVKADDTIVQPDLTNLRLRNPADGAHVVEAARVGSRTVLGLSAKRPSWATWADTDKPRKKKRKGGGKDHGDVQLNSFGEPAIVLHGGRLKRS